MREFDPGNPEILPLARRWVEKRPKRRLGEVFPERRTGGKPARSRKRIEEARAREAAIPEVAWRHHHLADLLVLKSRWGQALAAIDQAILLEPKRAAHHYLRGEILVKMGRVEEARRSAEDATHCEDTVPWHFHLLGHICALLGDHPTAARGFEKAAALEPLNYQHQFRLAQEYRQLKDRERLFESLNEAMRLKPNDGDIIGFKATALREFDHESSEILSLARRWVERKPEDGSARFFLSDELAKAGDVESAIEQAQAAIACDPKVPWRHHHLADLLIRKSQWDQGLAAIDQAILLDPKRATHHYIRGEILLKLGRLEEARSAAAAATQCQDTVPWHFHLLGHVSTLRGDHAGAAQAFERAAALEPSNYEHHFRLAQEYRALHDRERTLDALEKALLLNPNDMDIIRFKATALREFGRGNAEVVSIAGS